MPQSENTIEYTTINHRIQKKLNLTLSEYCVANSIYYLSTNPKNPYEEWCGATNQSLADWIGITVRAVTKIVKRLVEKGIIVIKEHTNNCFKKTTDLWNSEFFPKMEQSSTLEDEGWNKVPSRIEQSSTNNNIYNNISSEYKYSSDIPVKSGGACRAPKSSQEVTEQGTRARVKRKATRPSIPYEWKKTVITKLCAVTGIYKLDKTAKANELAVYNLITSDYYDKSDPQDTLEDAYQRVLKLVDKVGESDYYKERVTSVVYLRNNRNLIVKDANRKGVYGNGSR